MDKREDDIIDDIPDGEEIDNFTETEKVEIPETLKGDSDGEAETELETESKTEIETELETEIENKNEEAPVDLSEFLDDNTEVEVADVSIDPDLDKALSAFSDDGSENTEKQEKEEEKEEAEITAQKKAKNIKLIRNIALICIAAVLVIGGGLFAFLQINKYANSYVMTFEGRKVSMEEFKFFLLITQGSNEVKESALENLTRTLILEKAVKDKNVEMDQEGIDYVDWYAGYIKDDMGQKGITMPNISDERLKSIISVNTVLYSVLMDKVTEELNYSVDEAAFAAEFAGHLADDKLLKYVITETEEQAKEVREALAAGTISPEDAIRTYSIYYDAESGNIEKIALSQIGLPVDDNISIIALKQSEFSEIIDLGGIYGIFIVATDKEAEEKYREEYEYYDKMKMFENEYEFWKSEAKYKVNNRALEKFDTDKYFDSIYSAPAG